MLASPALTLFTLRSDVTAMAVVTEKGECDLPWSTMSLALIVCTSFVEYETAADLVSAVEKLDGQEFKGATVRCISDVSPHVATG